MKLLRNLGITAVPVIVFCLLLMNLACDGSGKKGAEENQIPNILFIMTDQHNARALGCYGMEEISTPNMDRLANDGIMFGNAICQTGQCVPSRYSIWTGRYARSHGTYWNGQDQNPDEKTVGDLFRAAGYVTGTIGKHHMFMNEENNNHGFDTVLVPRVNLKPVDTLPFAEAHPGKSYVGRSSLSNEEHTCGLITQASLDFIRANKEKPFVLWCSYFGPHTPINPSSPWAEQYDPESLTLPLNHRSMDENIPDMDKTISKSGAYSQEESHRKTLAMYYGFVSQIDYNIGRMLKELEELGLMENTIVVYTADHGEMMAEHQCWTKGLTGYDATVRVPLIIRDPDVFTGGGEIDKMVCSIDLLPTLLDLAGLEIPETIQGKSLRPSNIRDDSWREFAISEIGPSPLNNVITVRSQTHKYILFKNEGQMVYEQFFNLQEDPWEMDNRMTDPQYEEVISRHKQAMEKWEQETEKVVPLVINK
jgi:arylsulfatase A-like enzyme